MDRGKPDHTINNKITIAGGRQAARQTVEKGIKDTFFDN